MSKEIVSLADYLEQRNPLAFKDSKGHIMYFKDYDGAYYEMMGRVFMAGPKYVDLVLLCMDIYGMSKSDSERLVSRWRCFGVYDDSVLTNWKFGDDSREESRLRETLKQIAQGLHTVAGTKFNNDMFLSAFYRFTKQKNK